MKTILVTGGAGFIGSHLCEYLVKQGNYVICVDNLFTGSKNNIRHLKDNFEFIRHDITHPLYIECDQIYNLACPASPIHYQLNPIKTIKCSTVGMVNMLGLAKRVGARILQASTSEVYGDPLEHPQKELYYGHVNCIGPRSCYDEGKRVAETLCMDYNRQNNVNVRIVRIFNTYGPKMAVHDGRVISNFVNQALQNEPITLYGEGKQTRSFCYVSDMVDGIVKMMNKDGIIGPINLGNPEEKSIIEIAQNIVQVVGSQSKIVNKDLPKDDPNRRKPDITLAKTVLGWEPKINFNEGIKKTIEYFQSLS